MANFPSLAMPAAAPAVEARNAEPLGVIDQIVVALNWDVARSKRGRKLLGRLAAFWGFVFGGAVPVATYLVAHHDMNRIAPWQTPVPALLVLGGLVFSAKTVFAWARLAFDDGAKALGFVVLLEGVMLCSQVPVLPLVLLALLVVINGMANACILSLGCRNLNPPSAPAARLGVRAVDLERPAEHGSAVEVAALRMTVDGARPAAQSSRRRRATAPQGRLPFDIAS